MRPRFSIRWLLIAFTVLTVVFYVLFVRPTVIAKRFASAAERGDYDYARYICTPDTRWQIDECLGTMTKATVKVIIHPRGPRDIRKLRRTMLIQFIPEERQSRSGLPNYGFLLDAEATPFGIRLDKYPYPATFGPSPSGETF